ncbi:aminotransferase [Neohortaea acidophila]|uniref:Branched-chain-amino-acid aminotransferase n=1 Tax=Neohortaea acidophila TaxID=245834 RepID=A0A6A6Q4C7_9PEZI|nr:aminotransferase [Neohortaea acidophila]KAF2486834.1 aminotransferase [Neohortaea acidophila]
MASSLRSLHHLPRCTRQLQRLPSLNASRCLLQQQHQQQQPRWQQQHRFQSQSKADIHAPDALNPKLISIDASTLEVEETADPKELVPHHQLVFGANFTDHMLSLEWTAKEGWFPPRITPYGPLSLDPATCVFHYGFECFEGMKAYRGKDGELYLFRPDMNMARFNKSSSRLALPMFDGKMLIELIKKFVRLDERFIPNDRGYSLYLRPTMIGTQRTLGVGPPGSALLYVIASPVGPYYPTGFKAISLEATTYALRAWPGGTGHYKVGGNYAPCIVPQMKAAEKGLHQNLWLFEDIDPETGKPEQFATEVGTMNLFAAILNKQGQKELVTAPLDGTILQGVTRDSILTLARERLASEGWIVNERRFHMRELDEAANEGRLLEVFGSGTAAVVSPVRAISWDGKMIECGLPANEEAGPVAQRMKDWIEGIQYGDEPGHPWSVKV